MTPEDLASRLNGREYRNEVTAWDHMEAKDNSLVIVYGASDDLVELEGAIIEELGANNGTKIYVTPKGLCLNRCEDEACPYHKAEREAAKVIDVRWSHEGYSWFITAPFPHATFEIMDDGEKFCRGIVFALSDVDKELP